MSNIIVEQVAQDIFSRYANAQKVFVTSDGQGFFDERMAKNHARSNRSGQELKVHEFERPEEYRVEALKDEEAVYEEKRPTVKEIAEQLKEASLEEVEMIVATEDASEDPRSSVYKLAEKRVAELTKENEV